MCAFPNRVYGVRRFAIARFDLVGVVFNRAFPRRVYGVRRFAIARFNPVGAVSNRAMPLKR
ncbi:hypothetical protein C6495_05760 [Candidatus Poribacteria bacterium]|nr:MAG: hypothetical protein C6495_05760 [Candidatus Poribacteria bacterium]